MCACDHSLASENGWVPLSAQKYLQSMLLVFATIDSCLFLTKPFSTHVVCRVRLGFQCGHRHHRQSSNSTRTLCVHVALFAAHPQLQPEKNRPRNSAQPPFNNLPKRLNGDFALQVNNTRGCPFLPRQFGTRLQRPKNVAIMGFVQAALKTFSSNIAGMLTALSRKWQMMQSQPTSNSKQVRLPLGS